MEHIRLYTGLCETTYNHHPVAPGPYACISPVYGRAKTYETRVTVPPECVIIQDSGAFSDNRFKRKTFQEALDRQEKHAADYGYAERISHRATYDLLIDEVWVNGNRFKRRWSEGDAIDAVNETVAAAQFLTHNRNGLNLIISAQAVTAPQYLDCAKQLIPHMQDGDWFGFGGWCITGLMPAIMMPVLRETVKTVIPFLGREGVKHVHIWGVIYPKALGILLHECDQYGITLSTDSVGPHMKPTRDKDWGYGTWRDNSYKAHPVETRGLERARHVSLTRDWLNSFRQTPYYKPVHVSPKQQGFAW